MRLPMLSSIAVALGTLLAIAMPAQQSRSAGPVYQLNTTTPVSFTLVSCTGELVAITGNDHAVVQIVQDASGGSHFIAEDSLQLTGMGLTSGVVYKPIEQVHFVQNTRFVQDASGLGLTTTRTLTIMLLGQGAVPNLVVKFDHHLTILADGSITSSVDTFRSTCQ